MISINESFSTGIPSDFASAKGIENTAPPSILYNSNLSAVDIIYNETNYHQQWILNLSKYSNLSLGIRDFDISSDIEILADAGGLLHVGYQLITGNGFEFYQPSHYKPPGQSARWAVWQHYQGAGSWSPELSVANYTYRTISVGGRYIIRLKRDLAGILSMYLDGNLIFTYAGLPFELLVNPALFILKANIRVHSILMTSSYVDPVSIEIKTNSLSRANKETIQQSWPGENSCKQTAVQTAKKAYGVTTAAMLNAPPLRKDFGFIEGVITRKTAPAVGQHVICLDDRFNLVAETFSGAGGYYRFDSLLINGLYAIHAYDNNEYKYAPVGADRRTPEAYP